MTVPVITIDGPSGAGKGTVSRIIAQRLGFGLLDSGALYRLTALAALDGHVELQDATLVADVARKMAVEFVVNGDVTETLLAGKNVSLPIRSEAVGMGASIVAAHPEVREALLDRQKAFAFPPGVVADGRDMGTVVFPMADLKIFLTASSEARAKRRLLQLEQAGMPADLMTITADIEERDARDAQRRVSPLVPAPDAVLIDSTLLGVNQVVEEILNHWRARIVP